jgi:hypothetical protein
METEPDPPVGDARVCPRARLRGRDFADGIDKLAVPADELLTVLLACDSSPALRERLWWRKSTKPVEALPLVEQWRHIHVPLPSLGKGRGGVVVCGDAGERVTETGQMLGERASLLGGKRGEDQAAGWGAEEGRVDIAFPLQPAEDGSLGAVRVHSTLAQRLGHRQRNGVQCGARPQEDSGSVEKTVEIFGEVPLPGTHTSRSLVLSTYARGIPLVR